MKNNKKDFFKNRIKGFYIAHRKLDKNRLKMIDGSIDLHEGKDKWEKDDKNLQDPEEQDDLS